MRWFAYFILAYVMLGVQVGLRPFVQVGTAAPNFVLMVAIFIALNAPKDAALLGCFGLGIMQDLLTQQTFGVYALSYGLIAMFVVATQQLVYRDHPATHASLAFFGSGLCSIVLLLQGWLSLEARRHPESLRQSPTTLLYQTLYTAVLAPIVIGVLTRVRRAFSFQPARRRL